MINTILFDLDGTLNNLDMDFFFRKYMEALSPYFAHLVPPKRFIGTLLDCTYTMIDNLEPDLPALEAFWRAFPPTVGIERDILEPIFLNFYEREFPHLRPVGVIKPSARKLMKDAFARGYDSVIATNPIFPKTAIIERLRWSDCADFGYAYITCGEEMHFCKPHPEFFTELLSRIGRRPAECLMVGNDVEEDMVAGELGLSTALVTDLLIDRGRGRYNPDWRGSLDELAGLFASGLEQEIFTHRAGSESAG